jgi:hypothetical protein
VCDSVVTSCKSAPINLVNNSKPICCYSNCVTMVMFFTLNDFSNQFMKLWHKVQDALYVNVLYDVPSLRNLIVLHSVWSSGFVFMCFVICREWDIIHISKITIMAVVRSCVSDLKANIIKFVWYESYCLLFLTSTDTFLRLCGIYVYKNFNFIYYFCVRCFSYSWCLFSSFPVRVQFNLLYYKHINSNIVKAMRF